MIALQDDKTKFYQWDLNQKVIIDDETIEQVHFTNDGVKAYVREAYMQDGVLYANIPNTLLQEAKTITVYTYDSDDTETVEKGKIKVVARAKPQDYVYTEDEALYFKLIEDRVKIVEENLPKVVLVEIVEGEKNEYGIFSFDTNYTFNELQNKIQDGYTIIFKNYGVANFVNHLAISFQDELYQLTMGMGENRGEEKRILGGVQPIYIEARSKDTIVFNGKGLLKELKASVGQATSNAPNILLWVKCEDFYGLEYNSYYYGRVVYSKHDRPGYYDTLEYLYINFEIYSKNEQNKILTLKVDDNGIYFDNIQTVKEDSLNVLRITVSGSTKEEQLKNIYDQLDEIIGENYDDSRYLLIENSSDIVIDSSINFNSMMFVKYIGLRYKFATLDISKSSFDIHLYNGKYGFNHLGDNTLSNSDISDLLSHKLDNKFIGYGGKILTIDNDGNVVPGDAPGSSGGGGEETVYLKKRLTFNSSKHLYKDEEIDLPSGWYVGGCLVESVNVWDTDENSMYGDQQWKNGKGLIAKIDDFSHAYEMSISYNARIGLKNTGMAPKNVLYFSAQVEHFATSYNNDGSLDVTGEETEESFNKEIDFLIKLVKFDSNNIIEV